MEQLAIDGWLQFMPARDREILRRILYQWRNYFGEGPSAGQEEQLWAAQTHQELGKR